MNRKSNQLLITGFKYVVALLFVLNLFSCQELTIDSQAESTPLIETDALSEYTVLASTPSNIKFAVSSNMPWRIETDAQWCIPRPGLSSASALVTEVNLDIELNDLETERTATLTINADELGEVKKITIVQAAKVKLEIQPIEDEFAADGDQKPFTIVANNDWRVTSSSIWLSFDVSSGTGNNQLATIMASAEANTGAVRTATVTIKSGVEEYAFEITQKGAFLEMEPLTPEQMAFASSGDSKVFDISSNIEWKAELVDENDSWVTLDTTNETLTVTATGNTVFTAREAQILITPTVAAQGIDDIIITITQGTQFWADVDAGSSATFNEAGGVILTSAGKARMVTNTPMKLGTYIWKLSSVNIPSDAWFDINGWPNVSPTTANHHTYIGSTEHNTTAAGGFSWAMANYDITQNDIDNLTEIKMVIDHDPDNAGKVKFTVSLNGTEIGFLNNRNNPYTDPAEEGTIFYFGFAGGGAASCTIDSFEAIPIE
ncbi:BACON domain-containing protein [Wocania ichthyoenteri]|uniref:BACON domain-containing protein n=1 Tax=Wocania ichthyoenteri TaxID=1230531 RepID=UPI00068E523D|nr:BACON domain-containing protein [Wocania ichthyoenteri]